jgi:hypothetical protein
LANNFDSPLNSMFPPQIFRDYRTNKLSIQADCLAYFFKRVIFDTKIRKR